MATGRIRVVGAIGFAAVALGSVLLVSCATAPRAEQAPPVQWLLGEFEHDPPDGLTQSGTPTVVSSPYGAAMQFDGVDDAIFLETNPLDGLRSFTVEVVMRPDADGQAEQRFLHIGECFGDRMMIETRLTNNCMWYLDTYIRYGDAFRALIDGKYQHTAGEWHHVALVVDRGRMRNYIDGEPEVRGRVRFRGVNSGTTAIGVRQNLKYWYKGAIYSIRITPRALGPSEFTRPSCR